MPKRTKEAASAEEEEQETGAATAGVAAKKSKSKKVKKAKKDPSGVTKVEGNAEDTAAKDAAAAAAGKGENKDAGKGEGEGKDEGEGEGESGAPRKRVRKRKRKDKEEVPAPATAGADVTPSKGLAGSSRGAVVAGTVYVEGISYDANETDVEVFFSQVGKPSEVRMPRWHDSGKPRGYAHVEFEDAAVAKRAIRELNGQRMMGRYLKLELGHEKKTVRAPTDATGALAKPPAGCSTIFVKNLPYSCDEDAIRQVMTKFGAVRDVRLAVDTSANPPRLKGFGYVHFENQSSPFKAAQAAFAGSLALSGRQLCVDYEVSAKPKGSFRRVDGKLWEETSTK